MEEIKVGEIARLRDGEITRIDKIEDNTFKCKFHKINCELYTNFIVKHSFEIKDLVQAGDIILYNVNSEMTDIEIVKEHIDARTQEKTLRVGIWSLEQVKIKEILTKEQFNQMKYIVGDKNEK